MSSAEIFQRTYSVLVENEPGVLARIAGLFSARGYNIVSLAVGENQDATGSRVTIVAEGTPTVLEQINKQLNKIIPVISVLEIPEAEMVSQELMLMKFKADPAIEEAVRGLFAQGRRVSVVDASERGMILSVVADRRDEADIFKALEAFSLIEICRTGEIALSRERTFGYLEKMRKNTEAQTEGPGAQGGR
ncbi:MAG: acetolactate synthase small subunit [Candidatus Omnitrophica bacterium]|nr:acetolactate synthase small subunit [Candidatus Omnitrophota bacterium]